jgi:hypothetical protein
MSVAAQSAIVSSNGVSGGSGEPAPVDRHGSAVLVLSPERTYRRSLA